MIKLPMYLLHLWLPKAHVEAPALGSIVLAAVLLKLRAYAFFRLFFLVIFQRTALKEVFFSFLLFGSLLSAVICLGQSDIKSLVAFSSISHIGLIITGLFLQRFFTLQGVWIIVLAHGFCSSALFFLANFHYERNLTRQLLLVRGQGQLFYFTSIFWVLFLFANFSVPPFLRLFGELEILIGLFMFDFLNVFVLGFL